TPYSDPVFSRPTKPGLFSDIAPADDAEGSYLATRLSLHPSNVGSFVMQFDQPLKQSLFELFMSTLVRMRGEDLLRVKGIVYFEDSPAPHLIQGVRHIYDRPVALSQRNVRTAQSILVFIVRNMKREQVAAL